MKKNILLLAICLFSSYNIFAQYEIEETQAGKIPIRTVIISDDQSDYTLIFTGTDEECSVRVDFPFYVTNLHKFDINEGQDHETGLYRLPSDYPEILLNYSVGDISGQQPLNEFNYFGKTKVNQIYVTVYVAYLSIEVELGADCPFNDEISWIYNLALIENTGLTSENNEMILRSYDICKYDSEGDIFQNQIYPKLETHCKQSTETGKVIIDCLNLCSVEFNPNTELRSNQNNDFHTQISPNPFSSNIDMTFSNGESNTINSFEVYSPTGKLVHSINNLNLKGVENYSIDLSHLTNGLYLLRINSIKGTTTTRIVKR